MRQHRVNPTALRRATRGLVWVIAATACAGQAPNPAPGPAAAAAVSSIPGISLHEDWQATVLVNRDDSIVLTLPSGTRQLQHFNRRAGFTLAVNGDGKLTLRLDSLTVRPSSADGTTAVGAVWSGQTGDTRVNALRVSQGGDPAAELTAVIRNLLPRLPSGGVHARMTWSDSSSGGVRVDIFSATERRTATWSSGVFTDQRGTPMMTLRLREEFEQLGDGSQDGRKMTMTSQGRRSGLYYITSDGRISAAQLDDSVAMMISIPATKQLVPTMRHARTSVQFIPGSRARSD